MQVAPSPALVLTDAPSAKEHLLGLPAWRRALLAAHYAECAPLTLVVSEVERLRRPLSFAARERLKVVAIGAVIALCIPIAFTLAETLTGGRSPQNALALTGGIFPLALSYALLCNNDSQRKLA